MEYQVKVNTQKSAAFLYSNSEHSEREIEKTIQFTIAYKDAMGFLGGVSGK